MKNVHFCFTFFSRVALRMENKLEILAFVNYILKIRWETFQIKTITMEANFFSTFKYRKFKRTSLMLQN